MKQVIFILVCFVLGVVVAVLLDFQLYKLINWCYRWTSNRGIQFLGKNIHLFTPLAYHVGFGICFLWMGHFNRLLPVKEVLNNSALLMLLFVLFVVIVVAIDANYKVISCTACDNGIRQIHYNDIAYDFILSFSIVLSTACTVGIRTYVKNDHSKVQHTIPLQDHLIHPDD